MYIDAAGIKSGNSNGAGFLYRNSSGTEPSLIPDRADFGLGMGSAGTNMLSLISNSIEAVRIEPTIVTFNTEVVGARTALNAQSDDYELVLADSGKTIEMTKATATTLTIPANTATAFPVGTVINLSQLGAGQVTVAITTDTLNSAGSIVKLTGQYSMATLYKRTSTQWILAGDLAA